MSPRHTGSLRKANLARAVARRQPLRGNQDRKRESLYLSDACNVGGASLPIVARPIRTSLVPIETLLGAPPPAPSWIRQPEQSRRPWPRRPQRRRTRKSTGRTRSTCRTRRRRRRSPTSGGASRPSTERDGERRGRSPGPLGRGSSLSLRGCAAHAPREALWSKYREAAELHD